MSCLLTIDGNVVWVLLIFSIVEEKVCVSFVRSMSRWKPLKSLSPLHSWKSFDVILSYLTSIRRQILILFNRMRIWFRIYKQCCVSLSFMVGGGFLFPLQTEEPQLHQVSAEKSGCINLSSKIWTKALFVIFQSSVDTIPAGWLHSKSRNIIRFFSRMKGNCDLATGNFKE